MPLLFLFAIIQNPAFSGRAPEELSDLIWIRGGTLIDGTGRTPILRARILLRGARILKVGPAGTFPKPSRAKFVRAGGMTILPGLIDAHVHLLESGILSDTFLRPQPFGEEVFLRNLRAELLGGVTLVRDLHIPVIVARRLAAAVRKDPTRGARLIYAGPLLSSPGGYLASYTTTVETPDEGRRRVAELVAEGAEVVKIAVTSRQFGGPPLRPMPADVVRAIVEEAHAHGLPVAAHVSGATVEDLRVAIEADVDSLEHMPGTSVPTGPPDTFYTSSGLVPEILARGITIVPTLSVEAGQDFGPTIPGLTDDPALKLILSPFQRRILERNLEDFRENGERQAIASAGRERMRLFLEEVGKLHKAGVKLGVGSDAGNGFTFHGNVYTEIAYLNQAGLSPLEAIGAATRTNAELLRVSQQLGTVEEGKLADLLIVRGDPLRDLLALHRVEKVFVGGKSVDVRRLLREVEKRGETQVENSGP